jgi:FtsP/CotA-like multicopper oxidase with cupredoxin domain
MNSTSRQTRIGALALLLLIAPRGVFALDGPTGHDDQLSVRINDNRQPAGTLADGILTLKLRVAVGLWRPEGDAGPALRIEAVGEDTGPLQVPAPLLRVPEGTEILASIRNDLQASLRVHGLCARDGTPCAPFEVPGASQREIRFKTGGAGTYHYWATSTGMPLPFRGASDTQLSGAFIVDEVGGAAEEDRVLVITDWTNVTGEQLRRLITTDDPGLEFLALNPKLGFMINGLSWPSTERLTYRLGERVRWRVVNLSSQSHPMHLHGFYFEVDALGDGVRDQAFDESHRQRVVTQLLRAGATMRMTWTPERVGNWVFHCHIASHVSPERRLTGDAQDAHAGHHSSADHHQAKAGMAGMVLGVTIVPADGSSEAPVETPRVQARALTLVMQTGPARYGAKPAYGFALAEAPGGAVPSTVSVPGPPLVLRRGEPVEITLVNRLPDATSIHWHGIELDSYYDGVHGWSGVGARVTPLIEPGATFTVRFTPPRTGTFIYHTHMHDPHQLTSGMYGALLVLEPGETFDPLLDHVLVIGRNGQGQDAPTVLNGQHDPQIVLKAGARHRLRFINITADDVFVVSLGTADTPATWRPLTKDGAPVPTDLSNPKRASQIIAVGETYDFEYDAPPGRAGLWLEVRSPAGRWQTQGRIVVK